MDGIKDRGMKKWQGLMLTEHVEMIKQWLEEDNYIQQTLLDDWEQQLVQEEIELAFKRQCVACITIWHEGMRRPYIGKISGLDYHLKTLSVEGPFGRDQIPVAEIIKVQCID